MTGSSNHVYFVNNAFISTDDYQHPAYRIRARQMTVVPDDYFEARQMTLFVGNHPGILLALLPSLSEETSEQFRVCARGPFDFRAVFVERV